MGHLGGWSRPTRFPTLLPPLLHLMVALCLSAPFHQNILPYRCPGNNAGRRSQMETSEVVSQQSAFKNCLSQSRKNLIFLPSNGPYPKSLSIWRASASSWSVITGLLHLPGQEPQRPHRSCQAPAAAKHRQRLALSASPVSYATSRPVVFQISECLQVLRDRCVLFSPLLGDSLRQ